MGGYFKLHPILEFFVANEFARKLRSSMTDAERKLWAVLRYNQVNGFRFRRQQPIGPYVADFYCPAALLIVELDGDQHGSDRGMAHDLARTRWLEQRGYRVLRFANVEVFKERTRVMDAICRALDDTPHPIRVRTLSRRTGSTSPSRGEVKIRR